MISTFVGKEKAREIYLTKHLKECSQFEDDVKIAVDFWNKIKEKKKEGKLKKIKIYSFYENYFKDIPKKLKIEAQQKFYVERRAGRIKRQPCVKCGKKKTHGHHEDYNQPLEVIWLCHKHHCERHSELNTKKSYPQGGCLTSILQGI